MPIVYLQDVPDEVWEQAELDLAESPNNSFLPLCTFCAEECHRTDSKEIFFKDDFRPGETIAENLDLGVAAHVRCVEIQGFTIALSAW